MPALMWWVLAGSGAFAAIGYGTDKAGDGLLKGAIAGAVVFYVYKQVK